MQRGSHDGHSVGCGALEVSCSWVPSIALHCTPMIPIRVALLKLWLRWPGVRPTSCFQACAQPAQEQGKGHIRGKGLAGDTCATVGKWRGEWTLWR